jgi:hypothetical protein
MTRHEDTQIHDMAFEGYSAFENLLVFIGLERLAVVLHL